MDWQNAPLPDVKDSKWRNKFYRLLLYLTHSAACAVHSGYECLTFYGSSEVQNLLLVVDDLHTLRVGVVPYAEWAWDGFGEFPENVNYSSILYHRLLFSKKDMKN